nr:RNA-dependent RNA polymerase [Chuviridae sp.]
MPPLQHLLMVHQQGERARTEWERTNSFEIKLHPSEQIKCPNRPVPHPNLPIYSAGPKKPFCGHATKTGNQSPALKFIEANIVLDRVKTLLDLIDWVNVFDDSSGELIVSNMPELIKRLLGTYTEKDLDRLKAFQSCKKTGTIMHHVRCRAFKESIMLNILGNIYTRATGISDCHVRLKRSSLNYKINFLHVMTYAVSMIFLPEMIENEAIGVNDYYATTSPCIFCNIPIEEAPMVVDPQLLEKFKPTYIRGLTISQAAEQILQDSLELAPAPVIRDGHQINPVDADKAEFALIYKYLSDIDLIKSGLNAFSMQKEISTEAMECSADLAGINATSDVRISDLKCIRINSYYDVILHFVIAYCYDALPDADEHNITTQLSTIPADAMPWHPICEALLVQGRLAELVSHAQSRLKLFQHTIYHSSVGVTLAIGVHCFIYYHKTAQVVLQFPMFTTYKVTEYNRRMSRLVFILKHRFIKAHLYPILRQLRHEPDESRMVWFSMLILVLVLRPCEINFKEACDTVAMNTIVQFDLLNCEDFSDEDWQMMTSECRFPEWTKTPFKFPLFQGLNREDALELLGTDAEFRHNVIQQLRATGISLCMNTFVTSLSECTNVVRSRGPVPLSHMPQFVQDLKPIALVDRPQARPGDPTWTALVDSTGEGRMLPLQPLGLQVAPHPRGQPKWWNLHRLYGFSTSAPSKLIYILNTLGIAVLPANCVVWCLADGTGGFAATLDSMTEGSVINFNTLRVDANLIYLPQDVQLPSRNNNIVLYHALEQNASDLTEWETLEVNYEYCPYPIHLMTCDAQTLGLDHSKRYELCKNVCKAFILWGATKAVLIHKIYSDESYINVPMFHYLNRSGCKLLLCKPPASGMNSEIYLVAIRRVNRSHKEWDDKIPDDTTTAKWYRSMLNLINRAQDLRDQDIMPVPDPEQSGLYVPAWEAPPEVLRHLPVYALITYSEEDWNTIIGLPKLERDQKIFDDVNNARTVLYDDLLSCQRGSGIRITKRKAQIGHYREAHSTSVFQKLVRLDGFLYALAMFINNIRITRETNELRFITLWDEYPRWLLPLRTHMAEDWIRGPIVIYETTYDFYKDFTDGVNCAIKYIGYVTYIVDRQ